MHHLQGSYLANSLHMMIYYSAENHSSFLIIIHHNLITITQPIFLGSHLSPTYISYKTAQFLIVYTLSRLSTIRNRRMNAQFIAVEMIHVLRPLYFDLYEVIQHQILSHKHFTVSDGAHVQSNISMY